LAPLETCAAPEGTVAGKLGDSYLVTVDATKSAGTVHVWRFDERA
jgi:hypothetical protein